MSQFNYPETIILVADAFDYDGASLDVNNRLIDRPHRSYIDEMLAALESIHPNVIWYDSPAEFINKIDLHKSDLIFPYWFGADSRNRHSLVPAICESSGIRYLGGDAYTKIVCNDKNLSKHLCREAGLSTPKSILIKTEADFIFLAQLDYPCVVKPLFEGSSLGISQVNLVDSGSAAKKLARVLLKEFRQPVLVEEYVPGKEVSICLIGWGDNIKLWEAGERYVEDKEDYFLTHLYSYQEKKGEDMCLSLRSVRNEIPYHTLEACWKIFNTLDKVEFIRIDGRLNEAGFSVIELTPETHLGADAEFCGSFMTQGYTYCEVLAFLIENCLERYQNQSAS